MAIITTNNEHYSAIANAIREKNGSSTSYQPKDMAPAILEIESGGTLTHSANPKDINFYDYDGELVYSYFLSDLPLAALPAPPDHYMDDIPLTSQGWNWSLTDINALTYPMDIGAIYIPTDGKTHLVINLYDIERNILPLYFSNFDSNGVVIDWGDGSIEETFKTMGSINAEHTYTSIGTYDITMKGNSLSFGRGYGYCIFGANTLGLTYPNMLQFLFIGNGSNIINEYAFNKCSSLKKVTIPSNVTSIYNYAFYNCYSLMNINIPGNVTDIGYSVVSNCYSLKNISISNRVSTIKNFAFSSCYSLTNIHIHSNVIVLENSVFNNCYSLISASGDIIAYNQFYNCYSLKKVIIYGASTIGDQAFYNCYALANITIPSSVTSIGAQVFYNCHSMAAYYLLPTTPPTLANINAFSGIPSDCKIYVPAASLEAYQTATNWSTYASYMVGV